MASENNLNAVFTDIANAIRDKKGSVDTIKPINMADEILTIETGGGKSTIYSLLEAMETDWSYAFRVDSSNRNMFYYMTELSENDFPPSNNVVRMSFMFWNCSNLTSVPQLNTSFLLLHWLMILREQVVYMHLQLLVQVVKFSFQMAVVNHLGQVIFQLKLMSIMQFKMQSVMY